METAQLLTPWNQFVCHHHILYSTLIFNKELAFYHSSCRKPCCTAASQMVASWKGMLKWAHVALVSYLELLVFSVSDRCLALLWVPWNVRILRDSSVRLLRCPRAPPGTPWELGLKCCCCWFEDWTLRVIVLMTQRSQGKWSFSELFLNFWQSLIFLKCWKAGNEENYIQIYYYLFFFISESRIG